MDVFLIVAGIIIIVILFNAFGKSKSTPTERDATNLLNEHYYKNLIEAEGEPEKTALTKAKELFDNHEILSFDEFYRNVGVPEELLFKLKSEDVDIKKQTIDEIKSYFNFKNENAKNLFEDYDSAIFWRNIIAKDPLIISGIAVEKGLLLRSGENAYFSKNNVDYYQEKTQRTGMTYSGLRWNSGAIRVGTLNYSFRETRDFVIKDRGWLFITNKRIVYIGREEKQNLSIPISSIITYYLYQDAVMICRNNSKNIIFKFYEVPNHKGYDRIDDSLTPFIITLNRIIDGTYDETL